MKNYEQTGERITGNKTIVSWAIQNSRNQSVSLYAMTTDGALTGWVVDAKGGLGGGNFGKWFRNITDVMIAYPSYGEPANAVAVEFLNREFVSAVAL